MMSITLFLAAVDGLVSPGFGSCLAVEAQKENLSMEVAARCHASTLAFSTVASSTRENGNERSTVRLVYNHYAGEFGKEQVTWRSIMKNVPIARRTMKQKPTSAMNVARCSANKCYATKSALADPFNFGAKFCPNCESDNQDIDYDFGVID
jgi:hypothetical protein